MLVINFELTHLRKSVARRCRGGQVERLQGTMENLLPRFLAGVGCTLGRVRVLQVKLLQLPIWKGSQTISPLGDVWEPKMTQDWKMSRNEYFAKANNAFISNCIARNSHLDISFCLSAWCVLNSNILNAPILFVLAVRHLEAPHKGGT